MLLKPGVAAAFAAREDLIAQAAQRKQLRAWFDSSRMV